MMTTSVLSEHIAAYATQVRAHLADLEPDVVEDLTDGLEADLTEALADAAPAPSEADAHDGAATEGDELTTRFGTPEAYAGELRSAAGLPAAGPGRRPWRTRVSLRDALLEVMSPLPANLRRWAATPWGVQVAGFIRSLAPVWWVLRAWVLTSVIGEALVDNYDYVYFPADIEGLVLVLVVLTVVSVQVGRGAWRVGRHGRTAVTIANVAAAILVIPCLYAAQEASHRTEYVSSPPDSIVAPMDLEDAASVWVGGERATNLFVYGPDGELIDGAQVVDQSGRPVLLTPDGTLFDEERQLNLFWEPRTDVNDREVWNAYPLPFGSWDEELEEWDEETQEWGAPEGVVAATQSPMIARLTPLATEEVETPGGSPLEVEPSGEPLDAESSDTEPSSGESSPTTSPARDDD